MANKNNTTPKKEPDFPIPAKNYKLLLIGFAVVIIGFALMTGGRSKSPDVFNGSQVFSFRRITLAPIVVMAGFMFEIWAIMRKPKAENQE